MSLISMSGALSSATVMGNNAQAGILRTNTSVLSALRNPGIFANPHAAAAFDTASEISRANNSLIAKIANIQKDNARKMINDDIKGLNYLA